MQRSTRTDYASRTSTPSPHVRVDGASSHLRVEDRIPRQFASHGSRTQDELPGPRSNHGFSPINSNVPLTNEPALPSIYTTPPYSTVFNQPEGSPNHVAEDSSSHRSWKRRRMGSSDQSLQSINPADSGDGPIPERDIVQYIDM